ncbi:MAG: hypothetical protein Q8P61_07975 [Candidatus Nanopelagicales bacterium]|nr:hypothetical protein [Candidatus Nanopelagicales bacterium]
MRGRRKYMKWVAVSFAAVMALTLPAACGESSTPSATSTASSDQEAHNSEDVLFVLQLMQLSEQAMAISNVALAKASSDAEYADAREAIRLNEERMTQARRLIVTWNAGDTEVPDAPGLLPEAQLDELLVATGPDFKTKLASAAETLSSGLSTISGQELRAGQNALAKRLASGVLVDTHAAVPS